MIAETTSPRKLKPSPMTEQRKQLILNFFHEYRRVREISPTFLEVAIGIGYAVNAEGTAHTLVQELIEEGWLKRVQAGSRAILPTHPLDSQYAEIVDPELQRIAKQQKNLRILRRL
jgi:SOS-response transcriptional repressor LexA